MYYKSLFHIPFQIKKKKKIKMKHVAIVELLSNFTLKPTLLKLSLCFQKAQMLHLTENM